MENSVKPLKDLIKDKLFRNETFFSIEVSPPKNENELTKLYDNLEEFLKKFRPLFCDITYHSISQKPGPCSSLSIANYLNQNFNLNAVLHFTCIDKSLDEVDAFLEKAKDLAIKNLFVLRGDKLTNDVHHFSHANELVTYVKSKYGSYFTICVAGYPSKHSEAKSLQEDIGYLKQKIDCGSDYVLTQIVYDADAFIEYVKKCEMAEIAIIPGIFPVFRLESLQKIVKFCKVNVPADFTEFLEQNDTSKCYEFSVKFFSNLCKKILESKVTPGLHFFTSDFENGYNFELVQSILKELQF